jgi:chromate transporter
MTTSTPQTISLREAFWTWCRVAALSFGGPAGQIAVMHRILVEEKKWISEDRFLHALNYCMLLPGPEAQQLATYVGWLLHRTKGGLIAGILFILPGAVSILALSILYAEYHDLRFIQAVFFGLKPAIIAIVFEAVLRISKRVLKNKTMVWIAVLSFVAIFFFNVPFPVIVIAAGLTGFLGGRIAPEKFVVIKGHGKLSGSSNQSAADEHVEVLLHSVQPSWRRSLLICSIFLPLWFAPIVGTRYFLGEASVFYQEGIFFSKTAVVTFGGAYSVLAYIQQQAVEQFKWLQPGEMMDGLGMAETTPGPLIMVVQFVGFMGAYRNPGTLSPMVAGILGSLMTTWTTFVPCFFWIFLGAPSVERLRGNRLLTAALSCITAAVVGVVLNLGIWFALHTLFTSVSVQNFAGLRLNVPDWTSVELSACLVAGMAFLLTFRWRQGMVVTLAVCCTVGAVLYFLR